MTSTVITTEFDEASGSTRLIVYKLLCSDKNRSVVNQIHKLQDPIMQNYLGSLGNTAKKACAHWLASLGGTTQTGGQIFDARHISVTRVSAPKRCSNMN